MGGISMQERTIHFDTIRTVNLNLWIYRAWTELHLHTIYISRASLEGTSCSALGIPNKEATHLLS